MANTSADPLVGVRVLDLSRVLAGPVCSMVLADLGADVIKVERPDRGDDTRQWGPPFIEHPAELAGMSAYFASVNRNKRSITLDMGQPAGREVLAELIERSDVVLENFLPSTAAKLGLTPAALHAINPRLVVCSISGFGRTGPWAESPGYDFVVQALSGLMSITGEPDGQPMKVGVALTDVLTGLYAAVSVIAALRKRQSAGEQGSRGAGERMSGEAATAKDLVEQHGMIDQSLKQLSDLERLVIKFRYGCIDGKPHTIEETASIFELTKKRIRGIEAKAIRHVQPEKATGIFELSPRRIREIRAKTAGRRAEGHGTGGVGETSPLLPRSRAPVPSAFGGCHIDLALFDCTLASLVNVAQAYLVTGQRPLRYGNAHPQIVPYECFQTADGYIVLAVGNDDQFRRFCTAAGRDAMASDSRFVTNPLRVTHRTELISELKKLFRAAATAEWSRRLESAQVPHAPVLALDEVFALKQVPARQLVVEAPNRLKLVASPIKFDGEPMPQPAAPPRLGEHTAEVLHELGYAADEIESLKASKVV